MFKKLSLVTLLAVFWCSQSSAVEISGRVGVQSRLFFDDSSLQNSLLLEPEFYWASNSGDDAFTLKLFGRIDDTDDERSHGDIREALWLHVGDTWELRAGIGKVYWGVTESNHLVDIINQTDLVESVDGEQKLGQPLLQFTTIQDWGVLDAFVLPGFRERTFPSAGAHLSGLLPIEADAGFYQHSREQKHVDYSLRYSHAIDVFDIGVSYFWGTNRDPHLVANVSANGEIVLRPYYDQIGQLGIDVQATIGDWLWKLEAIHRDDSVRDFGAMTAGFEYTWVGIGDSVVDMGLLSEISRDSRNDQAPTPSERDIFIGARFTFNDIQSTDLLVGYSQALDYSDSYSAFVECSRRLGDVWKLTVDARLFHSDRESDPVYQFNNDDYASVSLEYFF
tara:strand:- start:9 stop:1184 length:1176 start_codon:yes stop_codon:yes gene_type:complete